MIVTRDDLNQYLADDLRAAGLETWRLRYQITYRQLHYLRRMRKVEYWRSRRRGWGRLWYVGRRLQLERMGWSLGFSLPPGTLGPGASISHGGMLVIHSDARIGRNCRLSHGVTVGASKTGVPKLGDDVFLGPCATVFGGIEVGDRVQIGAGAVVHFDVGPDSLILPAAVINRPRTAPTWQQRRGIAVKHVPED